MAVSYHQLGTIAQDRGDYDEATRQYQRAIDISERLGDQAGMATTCSQLGILEAERGGPEAVAIAWHVKALAIRLRLGIPQAVIDLRRLAVHRSGLGPGTVHRLAVPGHQRQRTSRGDHVLGRPAGRGQRQRRLRPTRRAPSGTRRADPGNVPRQ